MHGYFGSSQNLENRGDLRTGALGFIGACSEPPPLGITGGEPVVAMALLDLRETQNALSLPQDDAVHGVDPVLEPDLTIELSIPGVIPLTSDSGASVRSEGDPDVYIPDRILPSESDEPDPDVSDFAINFDDAFVDLPTKRRKGASGSVEGAVKVGSKQWKRKYDLTRKYQIEWAAKAPWSEGIFRDDGLLHLVKCTICSVVGRKTCVMAPKWDTLKRHGLRKCHVKNSVLFATRRPTSVMDQIQGCTSAEVRKKWVQFATVFSLLCSGRPMTEFVERFDLFLGLPDLPTSHWSIGSGWIMAAHIYDFVKKQQSAMIQASNFIALSVDETSTIDNTSVIVIHAYVLCDWGRQSLMIALSKLESDGATADSLTRVIMSALLVNSGLDPTAIASKLLCFGVDGVAAFQGHKNGVTKQIKEEFAPYANEQHCCAHKLQLAAQVLSETELMSTVEDVLQTTHAYFAHSPKRVSEFRTLAQLMETKGLKLLKNVKTCWISCHAPMRRLISEWKPVMAKMHEDGNRKRGGKKARVS